MDDIEHGQEREQLDRALAIAAAAKSAPVLPWTGECYNCASRMQVGMRFCGPECRTDWEQRRNAEIRRGRNAHD